MIHGEKYLPFILTILNYFKHNEKIHLSGGALDISHFAKLRESNFIF